MEGDDSSGIQGILGALVTRASRRGSLGVEALIQSNRRRAERRQSQRELQHYWARLGKTAYHLTNAGELDHPAMHEAIRRIDSIKEDLARIQERD